MLSDLQNSQYCIKMSLVQMFLVKRLSPGGETVSFAAGSPAAADTELYANPSWFLSVFLGAAESVADVLACSALGVIFGSPSLSGYRLGAISSPGPKVGFEAFSRKGSAAGYETTVKSDSRRNNRPYC